MKRIQLRFLRSNDFTSNFIRWYTWSDWSHVEVVWPDELGGNDKARYLGAHIDGGVLIRPENYANGAKGLVKGLAYVEVEDEVADKVYSFLKDQVGKPYDFTALLGIGFHRDWGHQNKWFCSELIAAAFAQAGAPLLDVTNDDRITPGMVAMSTLVKFTNVLGDYSHVFTYKPKYIFDVMPHLLSEYKTVVISSQEKSMSTFAKTNRKFAPRTAGGLLPHQVAKAYGFPYKSVDMSKRKIGVLELGGMYDLKVLAAYCAKHGYKMPPLKNIFCDGAIESSSGADGEVALDLLVIIGALNYAAAPGTELPELIVAFGPNSDKGFNDAALALMHEGVDTTSCSWGAPENAWDSSSRTSLDETIKSFAEQGGAFYAASGDNGSSDGEWLGNHVDYPASSPFAIACGGTYLTLKSDDTRNTETGWTGSGGGISSVYGKPAWQSGIKIISGRLVPDVAGNAGPNSGYIIDVDGNEQQVGGTSGVAPLYAAIQVVLNASVGRKVGNMHTKLYGYKSCFFDVTFGGNGAFVSLPGYDCVTGNGVLDVSKFIEAVKAEEAKAVA